MSKSKGIVMTATSIQGILADLKTATRLVMTPQPIMDESGMWHWKDCQWMDGGLGFPVSGIEDHARYRPGDILWVRETWCRLWALDGNDQPIDGTAKFYYAADGYNPTPFNAFPDADGFHGDRNCPRWKPSIHMPKEAARIFLRVKDVRVERVQDISEEDAKAEGIKSYWLTKEGGKNADDWHESSSPPFIGAAKGLGEDLCHTRREAYQQLWDILNAKRDGGKYAWNKNPWVWVYEFERCAKPEGWCAG